MGKSEELCVVVLDVGLGTHDAHVPFAVCCVQNLLHSKMMHKVNHRVALVLFGTNNTSNEPHAESAAQGDSSQYVDITTMVPMGYPDGETLRHLHTASRGQRGRSDFVDALLVGVDILNKEVEERSESATASKRIVLISGFLHAAGEDPGGEIVEGLAQAITHHGAKLQVISLDIPEQDAAHARAKNANSVLLDALLSHVDHSVHSVTHAPELIGALPAKEYASVATLSGKLDIGTELHISVKLATKTMQEKFPGLGKEAPPVAEGMGSDLEPTTVVSTTEYYRQDDPDKKAVPLEDRTKAYRYGKQIIPMLPEDTEAATYKPPRGLQVLGFVDAQQIPRHYYMGHAQVMVADKGSKPSQLALAALVRALDNKSQVAIVRAMMRAQGSVALMVAVPVLATGAAPDHFVINELPFQEDIRWFTFAPFSREDKLPDADQMKATRNLVDAMTLDVQTRPELAPETTPNPALHRFIQFVCDKAVDDDVKVPEPEDDALLTCVTQPRVEVMPKAAQAAAAAGAAFPTGMKARGAGRAVRRLRPGYELDDFTEMMEQGSFTDAISAMRKHIESLVDASVGAHHFQEALQKLKAVREQCVQRKVAKTFNEHLRHLWGKYAELPMKRAFLGMVGQEGITLVSRDDVDVVGAVTPEEAALFLEKANAAAENGE